MISSQQMADLLRKMLGTPKPAKLDLERLETLLNEEAQRSGVDVTEYGYVMWVMEHAGTSGIFKGALGSLNSIDGYVADCVRYRDDMLTQLLNAKKYAESVFGVISSPDICVDKLEGMSFPYVLYVLFSVIGQKQLVDKYRDAAVEQLRRYPSTLDKLPEEFRAIGEEIRI